MRIKRTFAPTMREALQLVKQEQGPDAVILGNKKVPGGVEILSAMDYDEVALANMAWPIILTMASVTPGIVNTCSRIFPACRSRLSKAGV